MGNNKIEENKMRYKRLDPRLYYLKKITRPLPNTCPECESEMLVDGEAERYCENCGLVVTASIEYVAGVKIVLPYGRH